MKILFDTNIVLDVMLGREPFAEPASQLMSLVESGKMVGLLCATTITTIHYLSTKMIGSKKAQNKIKTLMMLFEIAAVNRSVIEDALIAQFIDFEDAVIYQAACHAGAEIIVTRDPKGFKRSKLPIYNANEMLKMLQIIEKEKDLQNKTQ
ncbi:MAG: PIN domain-containing protein [Desulfobacterales bacterium]|nr:PIN domain-containing protein [Desulfobacterales bacterium]